MTYGNQTTDASRCIMCGQRTYSGLRHDCTWTGVPAGMTAGKIEPVAYGCICPPGANLTCQAPLCPRRGISTEGC